MSHVYILGFYNRNNLGDDTMAYVFQKFFDKYFQNVVLHILNTDDTHEIPQDPSPSAVIVGGGDLINDYFLEKIKHLIEPLTCPIYAVGVGFPYPSKIQSGECDIFDFIIGRNEEDLSALQKKYSSSYVRYFPDLTFLLPSLQLVPELRSDPTKIAIKYGLNPDKKNIAIFLARPIYHSGNPQGYQNIINTLTIFLSKLTQSQLQCGHTQKSPYQVLLFSMNTHQVNDQECDIYLNKDLKNQPLLQENSLIRVVDRKIDYEDIPDLFSQFYMTIATRYHAHIFSILGGTPILSLYATRKVESILKSAKIEEYSMTYERHKSLQYSSGLDMEKMEIIFNKINDNYEDYQEHLRLFRETCFYSADRLTKLLQNLLCCRIYRTRPDTFHYKAILQNKLKHATLRILNYLKLDPKNHPDIVNPYDLFNLYDKKITLDASKTIARIVSLSTIGQLECKYLYGLEQQVLKPTYVLAESMDWILRDYLKSPIYIPRTILANPIHQSYRKLKMNMLEINELKGYHRSGWPFVLHNIRNLHRKTGILFDPYLDKTFGWQADFLTKIGDIPYQESWIGFFHHTPDETYSPNNLAETFRHLSFQTSLVYCKGILVMSEYIKDWIKTQLNMLGYNDIPILKLKHPTEVVKSDNKFTPQKLKNNPEQKVIQIGAWLRDTYIIYDLPQPYYFKKCALKGKAMENYYPQNDFTGQIKDALLEIGCKQNSNNNPDDNQICRPISRASYDIKYCNKYIAGLYHAIKRKEKSVHIIEQLTDNEYDKLLSENVVMIYLQDVSACNTLIECIVRDTPILINQHPAVVEYLGEDYPFYYKSVEEAQSKLDDPLLIMQTYIYLLSLNKSDLTIDYFMHNFINSDLYRSL